MSFRNMTESVLYISFYLGHARVVKAILGIK